MRSTSALIIIALYIPAGRAMAGWATSGPLVVNKTTRVAYGQLSTVRSSSSNAEFIGCRTDGNETICEANKGEGNYAACRTDNPVYVPAAQMINESSHIYFTWNSTNVCTSLHVHNGSYHFPTGSRPVYPNPHEIFFTSDPGVEHAEGSLIAARTSSDSKQYIGCFIKVSSTSQVSVLCQARDSTGSYRHCTSADPRYAEAVQMIRESSFVSFTKNATTHACTQIAVSNGPWYY